MGISDRDYMRRRPEDDHGGSAGNATVSRLVAGLSGFFARHPRFGLWLAAVLGAAILIALILARFG